MSSLQKRRNKGIQLAKPVKIHGVLRFQQHGFVHRDKNSTVNIMSIYLALAAGHDRTSYLRHPSAVNAQRSCAVGISRRAWALPGGALSETHPRTPEYITWGCTEFFSDTL